MESADGTRAVRAGRDGMGAFARTTRARIKQIPEMGEQSRKVVEQRYQWLDRELKGKQFIAGDKYSIADISAMVVIDFAKFNNISIQPEQKNLARWHQAVSSRPSATA